MNKQITLLELFSGIGGFSKGLMDSGFIIKKHYFSEIDKHAIANYKYNFPDAQYIGSVTNVRHIIRTIRAGRTDKLLITFGSPCQDFSLAGKRLGMEGKRSSLITFAIFLIKWLRPDVYIWENVKGAYSSNAGADYWGIIQAFANINGYRCEQQLLNTSWFLPQNRERIFFIGHLRGKSTPKVFPFRESDFGTNEGEQEYETTNIRTITAVGHSGGQHSGMTVIRTLMTGTNGGQHQNMTLIQRGRGYNKGGEMKECPTISSNSFEHNNHVFLSEPSRRDGENRIYTDIAPAVQGFYGTGGNNIPYVNNARRLTEIECERLQGYPDDWTKYGIYEKQVWINKKLKTFEIIESKHVIPKTQRYKLCGNAVTTKVVKAIGERINF